MISKLYNLACEVTTSVGTGTITLSGAMPSYISFAQAGAQNGDILSYSIEEGDNREVGRGIYNRSGAQPTLTRNVLKSTNANNPINLDGKAEVSIVAAAEDLNEIAGGALAGASRNFIDNSFFDIWQRGSGPFAAGFGGVYSADRWWLEKHGDADASVARYMLQTSDLQVLRPLGVNYRNSICAEITFSGSGQSNSFVTFGQSIEHVALLAGVRVIVSFYARWQYGTMSLSVHAGQWSFGGAPSFVVSNGPAISRQIITVRDTWQRYSVAINIPEFYPPEETTATDVYFVPTDSRPGGVGNQTGILYIYGVQVEIAHGTQTDPSHLERVRPEADTMRCQRFLHYGNVYLAVYQVTGGRVGVTQTFPTRMRAIPTILITPGTSSGVGLVATGTGSPQHEFSNFWAEATLTGTVAMSFWYEANAEL